MQLFASVYLDEDTSVVIADLLKANGIHALTVRDAGQLSKSDEQQLLFAASKKMAILTHNRADFEELAAAFSASGRSHSGIIIAVRRTPHEILEKLLHLLNEWTADEIDNQVFYI
jgi:predicted nuclease of predicted toxin-antitoxin system